MFLVKPVFSIHFRKFLVTTPAEMTKEYKDVVKLPDISYFRAKFSYFITFSTSILESLWVKKTAVSITNAVLFSRLMNTKSCPISYDQPITLKIKKFALEQVTKTQRGRDVKLHSLTSVLDGGQLSTPHPGHFTPQERPGTHCRGGWVGLRAGLEGCGTSCLHWDLIPRLSSQQQSHYTDCAIPAHMISLSQNHVTKCQHWFWLVSKLLRSITIKELKLYGNLFVNYFCQLIMSLKKCGFRYNNIIIA
jgi:hypothetical protein